MKLHKKAIYNNFIKFCKQWKDNTYNYKQIVYQMVEEWIGNADRNIVTWSSLDVLLHVELVVLYSWLLLVLNGFS